MTAYRESAAPCPACSQPLEPHALDEPVALVDLCTKCGGVWLDWEDGDFTELARRVPAAPGRELPREGPGSCPRCHTPLAVELFQGTAEVLRCGDCAGAFVPYASIGPIAAGTPAEARAEREEPDAPEPREAVWRRVARALRDWAR